MPRVALVYHVHRDMYVEELGRTRRARRLAAGDAAAPPPLRRHAVRDDLAAPREEALVELGVAERATSRRLQRRRGRARSAAAQRSPAPSLLYLGRIKRYKRLELLLDVLEGVPGAHLDVAGEGDHREAFEAEVAARGLADRVTLHGFVSEERKRELYAARVGHADRVVGRGLVPDGDGGRRLCARRARRCA